MLNTDACLRFFAAAVLLWWKECPEEELGELARFLDLPEHKLRAMPRPRNIHRWARR